MSLRERGKLDKQKKKSSPKTKIFQPSKPIKKNNCGCDKKKNK
jgi:hypothetical protein